VQRHDVNDTVEVRVKWFNKSGVPTEPTAVKAGFISPSGVTTQVAGGSITHDTSTDPDTGSPRVGQYTFLLKFTEGSDDVPWYARWEATGAVEDAVEVEYWVRVPRVVLT
jgi:hypothetical protein